MPEDTTPPATPQAGDPGTNPQPQAGDPQPTPQAGDGENISLEEAKKLRSEAANLRKRMKAYEEAEAATKAAQMTEQEKLQKQHADLQSQHDTLAAELLEARVHQEVGRLAGKLNFIVSPELVARLLDWEEIEFGDDAKPANIEKLLEKLAKSAPELVRVEQPANTQPANRPPVTPAMNPGRSSITQPGAQPGKIPTLDEYFRSHT